MALDDLKTLRQKSIVELEKLELELRDKLWNLRSDLARGKVKNVQEVRATRLHIARVMTLAKELQSSTTK